MIDAEHNQNVESRHKDTWIYTTMCSILVSLLAFSCFLDGMN